MKARDPSAQIDFNVAQNAFDYMSGGQAGGVMLAVASVG